MVPLDQSGSDSHLYCTLARLVWTLICPLLLLRLIASLLAPYHGFDVIVQIAAPFFFLVGTSYLVARVRLGWPRGAWAKLLVPALASVLLPLVVALTHLRQMVELRTSLLVVLLWGSIVEEVVFRSLLPQRCLAILRNRCTTSWVEAVAFIAPQILFAVSHDVGNILESPFSGFSATEFTRLVASGLMLQVVQILFGIGAAIGAHASINAVLLLGSGVGVGSPELVTTIPLLVFGLLLLSAVIHTEPRQAASHNNTEG